MQIDSQKFLVDAIPECHSPNAAASAELEAGTTNHRSRALDGEGLATKSLLLGDRSLDLVSICFVSSLDPYRSL